MGSSRHSVAHLTGTSVQMGPLICMQQSAQCPIQPCRLPASEVGTAAMNSAAGTTWQQHWCLCQASTRSCDPILLAWLQDNPNVSENMVKVAAERGTLQQLLQHCSHELEAQQQAPALVRQLAWWQPACGQPCAGPGKTPCFHDGHGQKSPSC